MIVKRRIKPGDDWKMLIKKDTERYKEAYVSADYDLCTVLSELVARHTTEIYNKKEELEQKLKRRGVSEADILKVCLMTKVNGFGYLLHTGEPVQKAELECYIRNAVRETGFTREVIMELARAIALSAGSAIDCSGEGLRALPDSGREERAYVIPASLYEAELETFREEFQKNSKEFSDYTRLEPLAAAGIIKAKFYLGYYLLNRSGLEADSEKEKGLELLTEAANLGDSQACAVLGDHYYGQGADSWDRAFQYYTGYGAPALNGERRKNVKRIYNQLRLNEKMIVISLLLGSVMAVLLFWQGMAVKVLCLAAGSLFAPVFAAAVWYRRRWPYRDLRFVPACMFVIWMVFLLMGRII